MTKLQAKLSTYLVELFILFLGLASFATLYINNQLIGEVTKNHVPLIDAAMEIKLEATTSHLWLEEYLAGDTEFEIERFWYHLDQADWYTLSMLQDGSNQEGEFIATKDPELRQYLQDLRAQIEIFREIAERRLQNPQEQSGSAADRQFDSVFHQFINKADQVETKLQRLVQSDLDAFQLRQSFLFSFIVLLTIVALLAYRKHKQRLQKSTEILAESEKRARVSEQQLQYVIDAAQMGFWDRNFSTGEYYVNDWWLSMLGLSRNDIRNDISDWESRIHPDDQQRVKEAIESAINKREPVSIDFRMHHSDDHWVWIQSSGSVVETDSTDNPVRFCGIHQDISERKQLEHKLEAMATTDHLTQLYNRAEMERFFKQEIERAQRYHHPISVFMIDIDCFKDINDQYGHQMGDKVLQQVAKTLEREMRTTDFTSRYGGEEFVVILPETALDTGIDLAERLRLAIGEIKIEEEQKLRLHVSIGIATYPENGTSTELLVCEADKALYDAKRNGRNTVRHAHH